MLTRFRFRDRDWFGRSATYETPFESVPVGWSPLQKMASLFRDFGNPETWSKSQWRDFFGGRAIAQVVPGQMIGTAQLLSILPPSVSAVPDFNQFVTELGGVKEVVRWDLYAYKSYATGGSTQISYFDQSRGSATAGILDTNLEVAGTLPGGQYQVVMGVGVEYFPAQADVFVANALNKAAYEGYQVLTQGWFEAYINQKLYCQQAPLWAIPQAMGPGTIVNGVTPSATAYSAGYLNNGHPSLMSRWQLTPPWGIIGTRQFVAYVKYNTAQTVTTAARQGIRYPGWQLRVVA